MRVRKLFIILCIVLIFTAILLAVVIHRKDTDTSYYYALSGTVSSIDTVKGRVGFTDLHNREWYWYNNITDIPWELGREVLLVMFNSGTEYLFDDTLISITFEGTVDCTIFK